MTLVARPSGDGKARLEFNPCFGVKVKLPTAKRTRLVLNSEIEAVLKHADERLAVATELSLRDGPAHQRLD